eukprot:c19579_g1_i3.p1 GENE.c19579_g1_i3~~c19579_g1_i3.p1  ORF type:complete len:621 (+),score=104.50 c19579_g1_i3:1146-3008(+)
MVLSEDFSQLFFVENGTLIRMHNFGDGSTDLFFNPNQAVSALAYSPSCGLYFTTISSNQVWRCSGSGSCVQLCERSGLDSTSCSLLQNPAGLAVDCACNLYVSNAANANLVRFPTASGATVSRGQTILTRVTAFFGDVEIFTTENVCEVTQATLVFGGVSEAQLDSVQNAVRALIATTLGVSTNLVDVLFVNVDSEGRVTVTYQVRARSVRQLDSSTGFLKDLFDVLAAEAIHVSFVGFDGGELFEVVETIACGDSVTGTTIGASDSFTISQPGRADMQYTLDVHITSAVTISTCNSGTNFDTVLAVFRNGSLVLENDDDPSCDFSSTLSLTLVPGTYVVVVEGFESDGDFTLTVSCAPLVCPDLTLAVTEFTVKAASAAFLGLEAPSLDVNVDAFCKCFVESKTRGDPVLVPFPGSIFDTVPCFSCLRPLLIAEPSMSIDAHFTPACLPSELSCDQLSQEYAFLNEIERTTFENSILGTLLCLCVPEQQPAFCVPINSPTCATLIDWTVELLVDAGVTKKNQPNVINVPRNGLCDCFRPSSLGKELIECDSCIQVVSNTKGSDPFVLDPSCAPSTQACEDLAATFLSLTSEKSVELDDFRSGFLGRLYCVCPGVSEDFC